MHKPYRQHWGFLYLLQALGEHMDSWISIRRIPITRIPIMRIPIMWIPIMRIPIRWIPIMWHKHW